MFRSRAFCGAFVAVLVAFGPRVGFTDDAQRPLADGDPAPMFVLKTMNPDKVGASTFALAKHVGPEAKAGTKAVVLSFSASYCEPCKKELRELRKLEAKFSKGGIVLAVVVMDIDPEGIRAMKSFTVDELALGYPVLSDRFGVLARRYRASTLPMTVVIEPSGKVKWVSSGFTENSVQQLVAMLKM